MCLACLLPAAGLSSLGYSYPTLAPLATGICGALGLAWLCHRTLEAGPDPSFQVALRDARWVLLLKSSSYFVVLAACMFVYEGRNPAASLLCWLVMASGALHHTVFDPGFAATQLSAIFLLLFGRHHLQGGGPLGAAVTHGAAQGPESSELLLLSALLALALAKVRLYFPIFIIFFF